MSNRVWAWAGLRVWGGVSTVPSMTHTRTRTRITRAMAALTVGIAAMIAAPAIAVAPAPIPAGVPIVACDSATGASSAGACYWDDSGGGVHFVRVGLATYDVTR